MKLEAAISSKTLVTIYQSTRCPNSKNVNFYCKKLKFRYHESRISLTFHSPTLRWSFEVIILSNIADECSFAFGRSGNQFLSLRPAIVTGCFAIFCNCPGNYAFSFLVRDTSWQIVQNSSTRRLTLSKSHTDHPKMLGITGQNSVARATWHPDFLHTSNGRPFPSLFSSPFA